MVILFFKGTPVLLSKFFSFGWNPKADLRPSFEQIVNEKLFDKIVTQVLSDGEEDIKSLCLSLKLSIDVEQIPWDRFVEAYCEVFGHDPKLCTIQFENLQAYLNVDVRGNQKILQVSNLYKFIEWWKPIKGASSPVSTLDELIATMKERWFWGDRVSKETVPSHLSRARSPGVYLVRLGRHPGYFVVSFTTKPKKGDPKNSLGIDHVPIHPHSSGLSIPDLVKNVVKKEKLKEPLSGRTLVYKGPDGNRYVSLVPQETHVGIKNIHY
eukprot:TRINITY_DN4577_c0_g1_i7.p1 TRINITY_DN4577_c0_g1~~TRINITY_DN4577_c0_g1_i7.p1  ORF type:complete len:267 (-),score=52.71 TRINITY_DN4577_c0_g1_i7:32-832(-)